jgi:acyl-coenzyme A synthetase/AMP-(fatty) acid ligase
MNPLISISGTPKPIYLRNGYISAWDSWSTIISRHHPRKVTYRHFVNARTLNLCSPQWLAGFAFSLNAAAFINMTTVMPPPSLSPLSPESIMRICAETGASSIITPPSLIESYAGNKVTFDFMKSLEYICYVGAALDHEVGDRLAPHTNLFPVIGSTERGGQFSFESEDKEMWKSYDFVPEMGTRFEPVGEGMYELHHDRTPEADIFQCGFYTFPDRQSLNTDELYLPVVDKYGSKRWISRGRTDDLVKLSWLAKFHASHIENAIARHPLVGAVLIGGEGRDVPYIIIEPRDHNVVQNADQFIDEIFNTSIYAINEQDNDEIRIPRETVMLADPALPFKRTMKMTIMRKEIERTYEHHINALYSRLGEKKVGDHATPVC